MTLRRDAYMVEDVTIKSHTGTLTSWFASFETFPRESIIMFSLSFHHELSVRIPYLNLKIDLGSSSVFLINSPAFREEAT